MASLDLRVRGGKTVFISAYATHGGHPYEDCNDLFSYFSDTYLRLFSHVVKIVIGDLNARVANVHPSADHVVGPFLFVIKHFGPDTLSNRNMVVQFYLQHDLEIRTSWSNQPPDKQVSYFYIGAFHLQS